MMIFGPSSVKMFHRAPNLINCKPAYQTRHIRTTGRQSGFNGNDQSRGRPVSPTSRSGRPRGSGESLGRTAPAPGAGRREHPTRRWRAEHRIFGRHADNKEGCSDTHEEDAANGAADRPLRRPLQEFQALGRRFESCFPGRPLGGVPGGDTGLTQNGDDLNRDARFTATVRHIAMTYRAWGWSSYLAVPVKVAAGRCLVRILSLLILDRTRDMCRRVRTEIHRLLPI